MSTRTTHHRRLTLARRFAAAGSCVLLLVGASAVSAPARAATINCDRVNQDQQITLTGTVDEYAYTESYSSGGKPTRYAEHRTKWNIGKVTIGVATCHVPGSGATTWRMISPAVITPQYDGLALSGGEFSIVGARTRAWATTAAKVDPTSVSTRASICQRTFIWTPLGEILGLPLPLPSKYAVGAWVATKALPSDKVRCGGIGSFNHAVTFTSSGAPRVAARSTTFVWSSSVNGPYKGVKEWTVTVR